MSALLEQLVEELNRGTLKVVDLTQPLGPSTPVIGLPPMFAPSPGMTIDVISKYDDKGPAWYWNTIRMGEHTGTHFDAPVHWITGKDLSNNACDTIPASRFIGPACVIDVTAEVSSDPDFLLTPERLDAWEAEHQRIPRGAWVLLRSGWSRRSDGRSFINAREDGPHSPGFDARTSKVLAEDRDVLGVGVETIGTDAGQAGTFNPPFPNHATMHGAGKFGLASLCNLDQLPPTGAIVIAAPLKIVNGSGSPVRVIAITPAKTSTGARRMNVPSDANRAADGPVRSACRWIDESSRIVVLTGAGISTDSGIPDFRGPQGVWTKDPKAEQLSNIHYYMTDPEVRKLAWRARLEHPAWHAVPNPGHRAIVELERRGKLLALVTQNIDGLHWRAGNSRDRVIEVHGTMHDVMCMRCGWRGSMQDALERVRAGEEDPPCLACGGILKSATISFGQALLPQVIERATQAAAAADLFIAVGTSLQVYPVAGLLPLAKNAGAAVVIVNGEPTAMDHLADAVIRNPVSEVLPLMCLESPRC